jgi:uncharacterized tellurite resistance protein B-like protein
MRILFDIILADKKIDRREELLFGQIAENLQLGTTVRTEIEQLNSLLALSMIRNFTHDQKVELAQMMGKMIIVDNDINYNEVRIYDVVNDYCNINVDFTHSDDLEFTYS